MSGKKPHELTVPIRSLNQNTKITGHYMVSCRQHIKELEKEIVGKVKELKNERARLKRLGVRKIAFAKGAYALEQRLAVLEPEKKK